ncbi:MAG: hypothetical protein KBD01_10915 [Acidobacteria bacterium]|nr:hypothetical protein [Acidobacteriota bacterium]
MSDERGAGRIGVLIWTAIMALGLFVGFRAIPVRMAVLQLHDYADERVQFAAASTHFSQEKVIKEVLDKAHELQIPLDKKQIKLEVRPAEVRLRMQHRVEVDLKFYLWVWEYDKTFEHMRL